MTVGIDKNSVDLDSIFALLHSGWPQAPATTITALSANLNARYAPLICGTAAAATGIYSASADLNTIFAGAGTTGVIVGTAPNNVSGSQAAGNPSGTVTSAAASCAGAKGGGTYTYTWTTSGCTANSPNSASTTFSATVNAGTTDSAAAYCTISDGVTSVNTGTIAVSLQNTSAAFVSAIYIYTSGTGSQAAPVGAGHVTIEVWGGGGAGGFSTGPQAGGGGSGAYVESAYTVTSGGTLAYSVGGGGANGPSPAPGGNSTVSSGSITITTMTATGGGSGIGGGGAPGAASGGNAINQNGNAGSGTGAGGASIAGNVSGDGSPYCGGGNGGVGSGHPGISGRTGAVVFYFTP